MNNDEINNCTEKEIPYIKENEAKLKTDEITELDLEEEEANREREYVDPEKTPSCFKNRWQEYLCVLVLIFAPSAATMAYGSFQVSLITVSKYFDVTGGILTWSVSSVMLANGSCLLLMGGLADAFGRRNTLLIGYICYALFALIGGFMKNYIALCVVRALQGIFIAASVPSAVGFLSSAYKDGRRKNMVMSLFAAGEAVGGSFGFVLGAIFAQVWGWQAVQFFLAIFFVVLFVIAFFIVPPDKKIDWGISLDILKGLDYFGSLLSLSGFTLICFSLTQVDSTPNRWHTGYIISLLIVGFALLCAFLIYETYVPKNPIMPMQMWKSSQFCLAMIIVGFGYMEFFGILTFFAAIYLEELKHFSIIITGCCFLTQPLSGIIINIFAGFTMHKISGTILVIAGGVFLTTAAIIWATNTVERNYFLGPFWSFIFAIFGVDLVYNVGNRVALSSVEKQLQSRAGGTFNTITQLASTIGLSISASIVGSKNPYYGTPSQDEHPVELFESIKYAYYFAIGCGATCLICGLFVRIGPVGTGEDESKINDDDEANLDWSS
ncbi:hypothetical protein B5S31_g3543 [[Candida] boidinii]|nr:hypothetical protein B5S31_g3543 [[Candida] boidinii]